MICNGSSLINIFLPTCHTYNINYNIEVLITLILVLCNILFTLFITSHLNLLIFLFCFGYSCLIFECEVHLFSLFYDCLDLKSSSTEFIDCSYSYLIIIFTKPYIVLIFPFTKDWLRRLFFPYHVSGYFLFFCFLHLQNVFPSTLNNTFVILHSNLHFHVIRYPDMFLFSENIILYDLSASF